MNKDIISNLLDTDYYIYGGFVRDYLILGEKFSDIDYYSKKIHNLPTSMSTKCGFFHAGYADQYVCGVKYHFKLRCFTHALSCNFFGFDKNGFFALPTEHDFCYNKAFELTINKKYYDLGGIPHETKRMETKLMHRDWIRAGKENSKRENITAPSTGIWTEYNEIAFERIRNLDNFI